ncbi:MAG: DUF4142 domain-containing protein [Myxococcota bacterium]
MKTTFRRGSSFATGFALASAMATGAMAQQAEETAPQAEQEEERLMQADEQPEAAEREPQGTRERGEEAEEGDLEDNERHALIQAHAWNQYQLQTSRLAEGRAQSPTVKQYAQQVMRQQRQLERNIDRIAKQTGMELEEIPFDEESDWEHPQADEETRSYVQDLKQKYQSLTQEKEFDLKFLEGQTKTNEEAEKMFSEAREDIEADGVRRVIGQTVPMAQSELRRAEQLDSRMGGPRQPMTPQTREPRQQPQPQQREQPRQPQEQPPSQGERPDEPMQRPGGETQQP